MLPTGSPSAAGESGLSFEPQGELARPQEDPANSSSDIAPRRTRPEHRVEWRWGVPGRPSRARHASNEEGAPIRRKKDPSPIRTQGLGPGQTHSGVPVLLPRTPNLASGSIEDALMYFFEGWNECTPPRVSSLLPQEAVPTPASHPPKVTPQRGRDFFARHRLRC